MMNVGGTIHIHRGIVIAILCGAVFLIVLYRNGSSENVISKEPSQAKYINLRELLSAAIDASKRGGDKVYAVRKSADIHEKSKGKTLEGAKDPVTNGDIYSHFEMCNSLKAAFPTVNIISEEKPIEKQPEAYILPANKNVQEISLHKKHNKVVKPEDIDIWIDPLDATHEYTENLVQYVTTMVCVAYKGEPVIGVIHKPFSNVTAWAWAGYVNSPGLEDTVKGKAPSSDDPIRIVISRSHKGQVEEVAKEAFGDKVMITEAAGAGYKSLEVLSGNQSVYVHTSKIKLWDICAGNAIFNHFGGRMTTLSGNPFQYGAGTDPSNMDGVVAALHNHNFYLDKLKKLKQS